MADLQQLIAESGQLQDSPAWIALREHASHLSDTPLQVLLDQPGRFAECSPSSGDLLVDYSRQKVTAETIDLLTVLAEERHLADWVDGLFAGQPVNNTEDRAALHMALRGSCDSGLTVEDENVAGQVRRELEAMLGFAEGVRTGTVLGYTGKPFTDIVNIGIGGSDLGLVMASEALAPFVEPRLRARFVSNIDGVQLADALKELDPETTLFVICSKSFSTLETQLNANSARAWFVEHAPVGAVSDHFVAVSVNAAAMDDFGIANDRRFAIWDWVGGRYSLWSAIGLSVAALIGATHFRAMLDGAAAMDRHFRETPIRFNLPALLGLLGVWNQNFLGVTSHAVLPYDQRLARFPAFLQQLEMESNGKRVSRDGRPVAVPTGTIVWGEPGSNAQHSFFQLLHQGTARVSLDFIAAARPSAPFAEQHRHGLANMLAQAEAFSRGRDADAVRQSMAAAGVDRARIESLVPHRTHPGGRASSIILLRRLDPAGLGALVALYEHKVFVQSVIWGINPFDQWGVELGKVLAGPMAAGLSGTETDAGLPGIADVIRGWGEF